MDAKLGMPEGNTSYLLQKWGDAKCVKESYQESRAGLLDILGFAPSVNCLEDTVARAAGHANLYFDEQEPVDPTTEEKILVATSDCKGVPMRRGVVEGACRHLVKDRMEQSGMRWRIVGAQAVLSLRAIYLNGDWDAFHAARVQAEQRKLYPYKPHLPTILNCAT